MNWTLEVFKELQTDNVELMDILEDYRECELIAEVSKGFDTDENRADAYFKENEYAKTAEIFKVSTGIKGEQEYYLLAEEMQDYFDEIVFDDLEEAQLALNKLEGTGYGSIEDEVEEFIKEMDCSLVEVKVKREHNNSGHFHSFNIYYDGNLFIDGIFKLNADAVKEMKLAIELLNGENGAINGWGISKIEKVSGIPSWEKSYEITFSKNGHELERTIELRGFAALKGFGQGQMKKLSDLIQEFIDFDELDAQLKEEEDND